MNKYAGREGRLSRSPDDLCTQIFGPRGQAVELASTKVLRGNPAEGVRRMERRPVTRKKVGEVRGRGRTMNR